MGIVIGYGGTLDDMARLESLIAVVRLFCKQAGWESDEIAEPISGIAMGTADDFMPSKGKKKPRKRSKPEEWPEEETYRNGGLTLHFDSKNPILLEETWRGIIAHPTGTESLALTFDGQGRLCTYSALPQKWVKGPLRDQKHYFCFPLFCKTTGEPEQHIAICMLLRLLRKSYISDLKVSDDTGYFRTGNLKKLREEHAVMAGFIGTLRNHPEFIEGLLKAAGMDEKTAHIAEVLPSEILRPVRAAKSAKKPTIH